MSRKLPRVREGDPIADDDFNALIEAARACNIEVGPGLQADQGPEGVVLAAIVPRKFDAKITGAISGGTYPFTEQFPAASGTWTAGTRTGTAFEENGNTAVPLNTIVEMEWTVAGDYRFKAGSC